MPDLPRTQTCCFPRHGALTPSPQVLMPPKASNFPLVPQGIAGGFCSERLAQGHQKPVGEQGPSSGQNCLAPDFFRKIKLG